MSFISLTELRSVFWSTFAHTSVVKLNLTYITGSLPINLSIWDQLVIGSPVGIRMTDLHFISDQTNKTSAMQNRFKLNF